MIGISTCLERVVRHFVALAGNLLFCFALLALTLGGWSSAYAVVVTDDFSDGTDGAAGTPTNPTPSPPNVSGPIWNRYDAAVFSFDQHWDATTGQYRLTAPDNGYFLDASNQLGLVGSYVTPTFGDFTASVDLVKPTGSPSYVPTGYLFGMLARSNGNNDGGGIEGYMFGYNQSLNGVPLRIEITKIKATLSTGVVAQAPVALDLANKDYTLKLNAVGSLFKGYVYEVGNSTPLVAAIGFDNNVRGVPAFLTGYPGVFGLSATVYGDVDTTLDNYSAADFSWPGGPTDFNEDSKVNAADYVFWRQYNGPATEYANWRASFGTAGSGSQVSGGGVPEPSLVGLALVGLFSLGLGRRFR